MVLTVADIERWNAGAVRDVFHIATARGNATLEASRQLGTLAVFDTWAGQTAEARKHTNASIRQDLDAHGNESFAVAMAANKAANDIEHVQSELRTLKHDAAERHMTIDPLTNKLIPTSDQTLPSEALVAMLELQPRLTKILAEADAVDAELAAAINMADGDAPLPAGPRVQFDPRNPFVDDPRFGHWENVVPPPYTGATPPPPWTGHKSLEGLPGKGPGGPSGFYVPGGKTWADDAAAPALYRTEQYRFRISGEDYTGYTRVVNGQQQQWVAYTYEAQHYVQYNVGAQAWAPKGPNEITGELGGTATGGLAGITPPPIIEAWKPVSLPQIASWSAASPAATYYIPDGCGGQFTFSGGVPVGGMAPPPTIPSMIAAPP